MSLILNTKKVKYNDIANNFSGKWKSLVEKKGLADCAKQLGRKSNKEVREKERKKNNFWRNHQDDQADRLTKKKLQLKMYNFGGNESDRFNLS